MFVKARLLSLKVFLEIDPIDKKSNDIIPVVNENEKLNLEVIVARQKFKKPRARFNEASLVKKLEELGIGRPSTYAPTISVIQKRGYVEKRDSEGQVREYLELILKNGEIVETKKNRKLCC